MTLHQLFWKLTKEKFTLHEINFGGAAKISTIFYQNTTYHSMNPGADVTYQTVNLFSSDKCFIYFISDAQHYIQSNQHNTVCTILVKVDVLHTCTRYMWSNDMFVLWNRISTIFMKIENTVYTSF